jgi:anti-sigma B factor antagonist
LRASAAAAAPQTSRREDRSHKGLAEGQLDPLSSSRATCVACGTLPPGAGLVSVLTRAPRRSGVKRALSASGGAVGFLAVFLQLEIQHGRCLRPALRVVPTYRPLVGSFPTSSLSPSGLASDPDLPLSAAAGREGSSGAAGQFGLDEVRLDGSVEIRVWGELDVLTAPQLREHCERESRAGTRVVVIDLSRVTFMDSSGMHALIDAHAAARTPLQIRLSPAAARVVDICGLRDMLPIIAG